MRVIGRCAEHEIILSWNKSFIYEIMMIFFDFLGGGQFLPSFFCFWSLLKLLYKLEVANLINSNWHLLVFYWWKLYIFLEDENKLQSFFLENIWMFLDLNISDNTFHFSNLALFSAKVSVPALCAIWNKTRLSINYCKTCKSSKVFYLSGRKSLT